MKVRTSELSFSSSCFFLCHRGDRSRRYGRFRYPLIRERIVLHKVSPGRETEHLLHLGEIHHGKRAVKYYEQQEEKDQGQQTSSQYHHPALGIISLVHVLFCGVAHYHVNPADILAGRPVAEITPDAPYTTEYPSGDTLDDPDSRTPRSAEEIGYNVRCLSVACAAQRSSRLSY